MVRAAAGLCVLVAALRAHAAFAQGPEVFPVPANPIVKTVTIDRAGGVHLTKAFSVVFGGIKQGSSMAAGPALSREFADGSFAQVKAVYSIRNFKLLQVRYDSRPILSHRAMFSTRLRWQDAPKLSLYPIGPDSPRPRAEYGERKAEASAFVRAGVAPHLTVTAGSGVERYAINAGFIDTSEDERLGVVPHAPGLATHPWFVHSFASAVYDTRVSPDYSRTGTALMFGTHHFHDLHDGTGSFRGFETGASQLFPTVPVKSNGGPPDWRGALEVSARAWLTASGDGSVVPFFLMPTLGGGDFLRGYPSYRFRDRDAVLLSAEYCWAIHPMIDLAAIYEAGAVAPTLRGFSWSAMKHSVGGGIRVHSTSSGLMRVDLARGGEGLQFSISFSLAGG